MATYYWRGGSGTWDTSSTANWSNVSGGAGGFGPPTSADDVIFNSASSGASYVVSVDNNPYCKSITTTAPAAGTLTFQNGPSVVNSLFVVFEGNINIHAACLFNNTYGANEYLSITQYAGNAPPATITAQFNGGAGAAKIWYTYVGSSGAYGTTTLNFCLSQTITFARVQIDGGRNNIVCTGSTITVASTSTLNADNFTISGNNITVTTTTVNLGNATPLPYPSYSSVQIIADSTGTGVIAASTFNVIHVRSYDSFAVTLAEPTSLSTTINNLTLRSSASSFNAYINGVRQASVVNLFDTPGGGSSQWVTDGPLTFTGAVTFNSASLNIRAGVINFNSTLTTNNSGATAQSSTIDLNQYGTTTAITFTGAVTFTGYFVHYFSGNLFNTTNCTFSSTLTANQNNANTISNIYLSGTTTVAGNTSLTNTFILDDTSGNYTNWVQSGASTLTSTTNPTSQAVSFDVNSLSMGTGAATFTSTNVILRGAIPSTSTSLNSSALVTVNGSAVAAGVTFTANDNVSFVAATLATWTDVNVYLIFTTNFTITGAGGFTLAGAAKNSSFIGSITRMAVTGPLILNIGALAAEKTVRIESIAASSTLTVNGLTGDVASFQTTGSNSNNNTVTGAASFTNLDFYTTSNPSTTFSSTFGWTSTLANINTISTNGTFNFVGVATISNPSTLIFNGDITCNANFSLSATSLIDNESSGVTIAVTGFTSTNAASTTTFTNARVAISTASIAGAVTLATNGGMYIYGGTATISGALTSSGAGTFFPIEGEVGTTLALNGAVTLVNANVKVPTITVAGGATKNFAYSLSSPIADNRSGYGRVFYNYPEIAFDTFTLTNTGGTFSVAGGGAANLRTFISPYSYTTATSAAMNLAVNPSFTDVDFWRIVPGGASTKPWTGTRLGNVGTLTNITFTAPKAVYFVGGAGSWGGAKWATSSGGVGAVANYPLPQDTIYFDSNSGVGDVTLPASVRFKDISVLSLAAGTLAIYSASPSATSQVYTNMFMSGSFFGPSTPTVGTFIFGNDTTYSYYFSYNLSPLIAQINLIVADSSSSDLHTLAPQNVQFMPNTMLQFASLGTTTVTTDIANSSGYELAGIGAYTEGDYATRAVNFTCARVGRITTSTDWGLGSSAYSFGYGAFNFGSCALGAATISLSSNVTIANTAYTVIVSYSLIMTNTANPNAGNVIFRLGTGTLNSINFYNGGSSGSFYKNLSTYGANASSVINFYNVSGTGFNCASFTANAAITLRNDFSNTTLTKTGGGTVSLPGVKVTPTGNRINASPANTWYVPGGTVGSGSTGWSTTSPSGSNTGGFFMF